MWAEIDCRLLPDQDPQLWLREVQDAVGPEVEIEVLMGFTPAVSTTDTQLYEMIRDVTLEELPGASFVPQVQGGFTDSHFFRDLGIVSYGYSATATPSEDAGGVHGNNERIGIATFNRGVEIMVETVRTFVTN